MNHGFATSAGVSGGSLGEGKKRVAASGRIEERQSMPLMERSRQRIPSSSLDELLGSMPRYRRMERWLMMPGHTAEVKLERGCEGRMNVKTVSMRRASGEMVTTKGRKSAMGAKMRVRRVRMRREEGRKGDRWGGVEVWLLKCV